MLSFLKFFIPKLNLADSLSAIEFDHHYLSFSINIDEYKGTVQNRLVQIAGENQHSLYLGLKDKIVSDFDGKSFHIESNQDFIEINKFFDRLYFFVIEKSKEFIRPESSLTSQIDQENRSLEWLKVTLMVLKNAVGEIKVNKDFLYQGRLFFGRRNPNSSPELRIQSLSLDIHLEFLEDHRLRVRAWNYKDGKKTSKDQEDLFAEFVTLKGPVFDEIILLLNEIRQVSFI